ncbi:MAG: helix-turn-helix transcriptional regulator [Bdellovibrio sp.]|nr:helix-turn-helix transcriptional regulator [Bdellovibrio sp.]
MVEKVYMQLESLNQFNKRQFKKFFGLYMKRQRAELNVTIEYVAHLADINASDFKSIESGKKSMSQTEFESICKYLYLDLFEIENIYRITHAQYLMNVFKVIDGHYPK